MFSVPPYVGPKSDHFDGRKFRNAIPGEHGFRDFLRMATSERREKWPEFIQSQAGPKPVARVGDGELRVTFIGHATVLIQMDGLNILTDPIWSERCSPLSWIGPKRVRAPGLRFEDLPPIDAVLISHNHYDHLDVPTVRRLVDAFSPRFFVPLGNSAFLRQAVPGIAESRSVDLDWEQSAELSPVARLNNKPAESQSSPPPATSSHSPRVTLVPARHFSGRSLSDRDTTLWGGFVIEGARGNVYFAGDSGYGPHFADIGARHGPLRLSLLPIGAYEPRWFMGPVHIDPGEAVRAMGDLRTEHALGIHFRTFQLTSEAIDAPERELTAALTSAGIAPGRFRVIDEGEPWDVPESSGGSTLLRAVP